MVRRAARILIFGRRVLSGKAGSLINHDFLKICEGFVSKGLEIFRKME
jgi:hypothetical protein